MAGFVEGIDRSQTTLFPASLEDYIAEDNPVCASCQQFGVASVFGSALFQHRQKKYVGNVRSQHLMVATIFSCSVPPS